MRTRSTTESADILWAHPVSMDVAVRSETPGSNPGDP
jgi:hypothetical protein